MTAKRENETRWFLLGLALGAAFAVVEAALGGPQVLIAVLVLVPLLVAARSTPRLTAIAGVYAFVLAVLLGIPGDMFGSFRHVVATVVTGAGGALAYWIAWLRARAERTEQRAMFLAEGTRLLETSLDYTTAVQTLARICVPKLADWCAVYVHTDEGDIKQLAVAHVDRSKIETAWELERRYPFHMEQPLGVANVIRTGEPELMPEIPESAIAVTAYNEEHAGLLHELGLRSAMFVPLRARGRILGAMAFATAESERALGPEDLEFARNLADRAALAIDNARLYTEVIEAEAGLRRSRDEMDAVLQGVASAITVQSPTGEFVYVNEAAARALGFESSEALIDAEPAQIVARYELFDEQLEPFPPDQLPSRMAAAGDRPPDMVVCFRDNVTSEERWSLVKARPVFDDHGDVALVVNIFDDITEQKRDDLRERFLGECSKALAASLDQATMLDDVAHLAVPTLADMCSIETPAGDGSMKNAALALSDPSKISIVEELRRRFPSDLAGTVATVIETGEAAVLTSDDVEALPVPEEQRLLIRELGVSSLLVAPLTARGRPLGAIALSRSPGRPPFAARDRVLAEEVGRRVGRALETAWLYAERSHIARTLQRSLLPPILPDIPGVEVAARFRPAGEGFEVGGDFYDVFNTGGAGWAIVIGDVCGKGPEAAALTGLARYTLRAAAMQEEDPSRILALLSEAIIQQRSDTQFCTAAFGRLELQAVGARLTVSSGGHPLPILLDVNGDVRQIGRPGTLLGAIHDAKLSDRAVDLRPGASLIFYTDGVTEAGQPRGAFGIGGLRSVVQSCAGLGADEIAERIETAVTGLEQNPSDDVAVLVLKVRE